MVIDVTKLFKTLEGETVKNEQGKIYTLRMACVDALLGMAQDERLTGEEKVKQYDLASKIFNNDQIELPAEDIAFLKKRIGIFGTPIIVGQAFKMLEGKE